jgi:selenocysteine lyase/cysteine desulfurase
MTPVAPVCGADLRVPLVQGGDVRYANLDYAASAPALTAVADQVSDLLPLYSSVHRGAGYASQVSTAAYEAARRDVAAFAGARADDAVLFTRNTTDALNLLATTVPGHVVHLDIEHHANLLPWQRRTGQVVRVVRVRRTLAETVAAVEAELARTPAALLAVTGASNVTGECLPIGELAAIARRHGARIAVDGAQLIPHRRISLTDLDVDYLAFSGHKLYAPFGTGVLAGRRDWLDAAPAYLAGGGAVRTVTVERTTWTTSPARHEAGTPNVIGAVALAAACRFIAALRPGTIEAHEAALLAVLDDGLAAVGARTLRLWPDDQVSRLPVVTFAVPGYDPEFVAAYLSAEWGIGVRDGKFCAHPLLSRLGAPDGAVRASLGLGSGADDVERLIAALRSLRGSGPTWTYTADHRPVPDPRRLPAWAIPAGSAPTGPTHSAATAAGATAAGADEEEGVLASEAWAAMPASACR